MQVRIKRKPHFNWKIHLTATLLFIGCCVVLLLVYSYSLATARGVYHTVKTGETLLLISKAYGVSLEEIKSANELKSSRIKPGDRLFIPGVEKRINVETLDSRIRYVLRFATSERWKYIVIHHSDTERGNADIFDSYHREQRNYRYGLGYHFVIANGTSGRKDGLIEVGHRWKEQMDGAHCRAGDGNRIGIGICLVGNFNRSTPTSKQFNSLAHLVTHLMYRYDIPLENVKGHGEMNGATSDCPGKNFPWEKLRKAILERVN